MTPGSWVQGFRNPVLRIWPSDYSAEPTNVVFEHWTETKVVVLDRETNTLLFTLETKVPHRSEEAVKTYDPASSVMAIAYPTDNYLKIDWAHSSEQQTKSVDVRAAGISTVTEMCVLQHAPQAVVRTLGRASMDGSRTALIDLSNGRAIRSILTGSTEAGWDMVAVPGKPGVILKLLESGWQLWDLNTSNTKPARILPGQLANWIFRPKINFNPANPNQFVSSDKIFDLTAGRAFQTLDKQACGEVKSAYIYGNAITHIGNDIRIALIDSPNDFVNTFGRGSSDALSICFMTSAFSVISTEYCNTMTVKL
jgi:hypothetical protein